MPAADLYRLQELLPEDIGGASGEKRKFLVEFIGKTPTELFPYTVANEVVSSYLATVMGFHIPTVIPHTIDNVSIALVLWMNPAARHQYGPPISSRELKNYLAQNEHLEEVHGAIVLDLFLGNSDRAFGPNRRNIAVDQASGRLILFDFGNALFYRPRERLGLQAGIPRLHALAEDLQNMFDKPQNNPQDYYFELLTRWDLVEKWCERVRVLPDYVLENAVRRIPTEIEPPTFEERQMFVEFLKARRGYLFSQIQKCANRFTGLKPGGEL